MIWETLYNVRWKRYHIVLAYTAAMLLLVIALDPVVRNFVFFTGGDVRAVGGYSAVDGIGQINPDGTPYYLSDGQNNSPNELGFDGVYGVVADEVRHHLFVADGNGRVMVYDLDSDNQLIDRVADYVIGRDNLKDTDTSVDAATTSGVNGLAVDQTNGRLFVSDHGNFRVLIFDVSGALTDGPDATNVLGQSDFTTGSSSLLSDRYFNRPHGLAYDESGQRLFVADESPASRVLVFDVDPDGVHDGTGLNDMDFESASNVLGRGDFFSFGGVAVAQDTTPNVTSVVLDQDGQRLFVGDVFASRVTVFDVTAITNGEPAVNVIGHTNFTSATSGTGPASLSFGSDFNQPGLAYDADGSRLFVGDGDNERVVVFDVSSITDGESAVNVLGQTDFVTEGGSVSQSTFGDKPGGLYYESDSGFLYAPDEYYHRILVFDAGSITNGETAVDQLGVLDIDNEPRYDAADSTMPDNGPGNRGFTHAEGIAMDAANHRLFVSDFNNNRVLIFNLDGDNHLIDRIADNVLGQTNFYDRGAVAFDDWSGMNQPSGIAYRESTNELFVANQAINRVSIYDVEDIVDGEDAVGQIGLSEDGSVPTPRSVAIDDEGERAFVTGSDGFYVFDIRPPGSPSLDVCGDGVEFTEGYADGTRYSCQISSGISSPYGVAYDADGQRLFVVSAGNDSVLVFDVSDINANPDPIHTLGGGGSGTTQDEMFLHDVDNNGEGQSCAMGGTNLTPAFDPVNNRLFVPDICNNRVMVFDTEEIEDSENAVDVVGQSNFTSDAEATTQNGLLHMQGLAFNPVDNYLYVADSDNHRVMVFEVPPLPDPGEHVATDVVGQLDGSGQGRFDKSGVNNGPNDKGFSFIHDFAVDGNNHRLFVADGANSRILVFNLDIDNTLIDHTADNVLGQADLFENAGGCTDDRIVDPHGLAYDSTTDRLFMSDSCGSGRVVMWDLSGELTDGMAASAVLGAADFGGSTGSITQNEVTRPSYLALDEAGQRLFVADPGTPRVLVFDISSVVSGQNAVSVLGQEDFFSNDSALDQDSFGYSSGFLEMGLAYDSNNDRLFVTDLAQHRTMVFDVSTIDDGEDAINELGQPDFFSNDCDVAQDGQCEPVDADYDPATDRLFISDSNNARVLVYDLSGGITDGMNADNVIGEEDFTSNISQTTQDGFSEIRGILFDPLAGYLYVAEFGNSRGMIFDVSTVDDGEDAVDMVGQLDDAGDPSYAKSGSNNGPNIQGLSQATGVVIDTVNHRLFTADYNNNRVLVFNLTLGNLLDDRTADFVIGASGFSANEGCSNDQSHFCAPEGLALDLGGQRLFVADVGFNRVMVFDVATITNGEDAVNVLGQDDFTSAASDLDQDGLTGPTGVAFDSVGQRLFVADQDVSHNRVMVFDVNPLTLIPNCGLACDGPDAVNVLGQPDFFTADINTSQAGMNIPFGVEFDAGSSRLFVGENENKRVLVFDLSLGITDGMNAANVLGAADFSTVGGSLSRSGMDNPEGLSYDPTGERLFVADRIFHRVLVFDLSDGITDGEEAADAYGQTAYDTNSSGTSDTELNGPEQIVFDSTTSTLYVGDTQNNRVLVFGPAPSGGGGQPPTQIGFFPDRIDVNSNDKEVQGYNVLVNIHAHFSEDFLGTVDVLLSNVPDFSTTIPFRYNIPDQTARKNWPKTVAWDLCFGLSRDQCDLGEKTVYARFYVNLPTAKPALTPIQTPNSNR